MRTKEAGLVVLAAFGCAAEVTPPDAEAVDVVPRLYTEAGEPVIGRLKTAAGVTELTMSAFGDGARVPLHAVAKRERKRPAIDDAVLGAQLDRSLLERRGDASFRNSDR